MATFALIALFAAATFLAVGTLVGALRDYARRYGGLRQALRQAERGVPVRVVWRETLVSRPSAAIYQLRFTPRADCLPFHPEHELLVAA